MKRILDRTEVVFTPGAAGAGTIAFRGEAPTFENIQLVTNVTRGVVIYQFNSTTKGSAGYDEVTNTLTLDFDTSTQSASDVLQVIVEEAEEENGFTRVGGVDPLGYRKELSLTEDGHAIVADGRMVTGRLNALGQTIFVDTRGFQSVSVQVSGTFSATIVFEASNDASTWFPVSGWWISLAGNTPISQTTSTGAFTIHTTARYFRVRSSVYTSGTAVIVMALRASNAFVPWGNPSFSLSQVNGLTLTAEDSAAISTPVIVGGIVRTALPPSTLAASDAIRATFSRSGQIVTKQNAPGDLDFYVNTTVTTNAQTAIRAAQGANIIQSVTQITYQNTNATATTLTIQDGSTTLLAISVPASMTEPRQLIFPTPLRGTANTALNYTAGTTGANVLLNVTGFNSY